MTLYVSKLHPITLVCVPIPILLTPFPSQLTNPRWWVVSVLPTADSSQKLGEYIPFFVSTTGLLVTHPITWAQSPCLAVKTALGCSADRLLFVSLPSKGREDLLSMAVSQSPSSAPSLPPPRPMSHPLVLTIYGVEVVMEMGCTSSTPTLH